MFGAIQKFQELTNPINKGLLKTFLYQVTNPQSNQYKLFWDSWPQNDTKVLTWQLLSKLNKLLDEV